MDGLVTPGAPAGAASQEAGVVNHAYDHPPWRGLLLEVAFEAKDRVSFREHLLVHRAVRLMAGDTSFAKGLVLEDVGAHLALVALRTKLIPGRQSGAPGGHGVMMMRRVTGAAAHAAFENRVPVR